MVRWGSSIDLIISQWVVVCDYNIVQRARLLFTTCFLLAQDLSRLNMHFVSVVQIKTKLSTAVLRKYITTRTKGKLIEELGDGKYIVEFETDEGNL